ncbi:MULTISPECIES: RNA helicase [Rhizobium/Agrobacterium group]|uniref:RNA helicase n=1 Tax=Rhizobium/Agrobacterium group TaxID=227290 RepID=UPI00107F16BE|nr:MULTISPECIES: RNA helicase [Rhizobium/Agrobacterium group]MBB4402505.1 hypothetical protein [Agrobacterium radiobacter]MBB5588659.1 hypothetical protein [Agrobacterium radiobacter]TGE89205.1 RNA helicase [Rhizobium sp. SEMIA 4032]
MNQRQQKNADKQNVEVEQNERYCGIVMPIAAMLPDYEAVHWTRVKQIISDAISQTGMVPRLVSDSDEVGVIHAQIVQNLYDDEIVVVDVSGKNPNVMFELGLRLAFDKPTVIVKDHETDYSFDTSPIKHIGYRRDQRFDDVEIFKEKLKKAIEATLEKNREDKSFSPFLRHFGQFTPKKVEGHEIPQADFILKKLASIEARLSETSILPYSNVRPRYWRLASSIVTPQASQKIELMRDVVKRFLKTAPAGVEADSIKEIARDFASRILPEAEFDDTIFEVVWAAEAAEHFKPK